MDTSTIALLSFFVSLLALAVSAWSVWQSNAAASHSRALEYLDEVADLILDLRERRDNFRKSAEVANQIFAVAPQPLKDRVAVLSRQYHSMADDVDRMIGKAKRLSRETTEVPQERQLSLRRITSYHKIMLADAKTIDADLKRFLELSKADYGLVLDKD